MGQVAWRPAHAAGAFVRPALNHALQEEAVRKIEAVYTDPPTVKVRWVDGTAEQYAGDDAREVIAWFRERGALRICET